MIPCAAGRWGMRRINAWTVKSLNLSTLRGAFHITRHAVLFGAEQVMAWPPLAMSAVTAIAPTVEAK